MDLESARTVWDHPHTELQAAGSCVIPSTMQLISPPLSLDSISKPMHAHYCRHGGKASLRNCIVY